MNDTKLTLLRLRKCLEQAEVIKKSRSWFLASEAFRQWASDVGTCLDFLGEHEQAGFWIAQSSNAWKAYGENWEELFARVDSGIALGESALELKDAGNHKDNWNQNRTDVAANQVFNIHKFTGILGNVQNSQVALYDYSSVQQLLVDHKIPKQDRRELEDIMDELKDAPAEKKPSLLKRGEDWIVKHKELLGAGAEVIGKAIGAAMKP